MLASFGFDPCILIEMGFWLNLHSQIRLNFRNEYTDIQNDNLNDRLLLRAQPMDATHAIKRSGGDS